MIKHYIEWILPGGFFSDTCVYEVKQRDCVPVSIPKMTVEGYRYFSEEEIKSPSTGEILYGMPFDRSHTTYIGQKLSYEEICYHPRCTEILKDNMKFNNWTHVVLTNAGRFYPIDEHDEVIDSLW